MDRIIGAETAASRGTIGGNDDADVKPGGGTLGGDGQENGSDKSEGGTEPKTVGETLQERLAAVDLRTGLQALPEEFDEAEGDWITIKSANPFAVLFLDYTQHKFVTPDVVKQHYNLLERFWQNKLGLMATGGNRVAFKAKYGDGVVENSLTTLKRAFEKIRTKEGIERYAAEINAARLQKGEAGLKDSIEQMMHNGSADQQEIRLCIDRGPRYGLSAEESAFLINKAFEQSGFKPFGAVAGGTLRERLLSVPWMTEQKIKEEEDKAAQARKNGREIFDNVYAYSTEEIGQIIFNDEAQAKRYIADGLLKNSIDYFSSAKASQFVTIVNTQKNEHLRYLQVAYRLKPGLPYRFNPSMLINSVKDLTGLLFETPENFKAGKEQFKWGHIEIWLQETNKEAHQKLVQIRDTAESLDTAYLEFLYTFNPSLPYRFAGQYTVKTPKELSEAINRTPATWEAGKAELFASLLPVWLKSTGRADTANQWYGVREQFAGRQNIGLEHFLHGLDKDLPHAQLAVNHQSLSYPKIQSGQVLTTELVFTNETRGALEATLHFSKPLSGVTLSAERIAISNASGSSRAGVTLAVDSRVLLKGVQYETVIVVTTFEQQRIEIPLSFQIVFPKNAFVKEVAKYAGITAACLVLLRLLITTKHPELLNQTFPAFLSWQNTAEAKQYIPVFGWAFLLFAAMVYIAFRLLRKKLKQYGKA